MSSDPSPAPALVVCFGPGSLLKACRVTIVSFTRDGQSTARAPAPPRRGRARQVRRRRRQRRDAHAVHAGTRCERRRNRRSDIALLCARAGDLRPSPSSWSRRRPSSSHPHRRQPREWREDWISREEGAVGQHLWCEVKFLNSKNSFKARP